MRTWIGVAVAMVGCARWAHDPRFGSIVDDSRPFSFSHNIELIKVSNGLMVATVADRRTNLATIDVRYEVGASADPPGRAGLAHLVEHLLFDLRDSSTGPTLGDELGDIALYSNAWTTWDATHYVATVPIEHLSEALALEARRMRGACDQLDDATFARERDVVLAEGAQSIGPLDGLWTELFAATFGTKHPYARAVTSNEVAKATKDEVCQFITDHYGPDRAILVVTGPIAGNLGTEIGELFGPIRSTALKARRGELPPTLDGATSKHRGPVKHPTAIVFLPMPPWGDETAPAYELARDLLDRALDEEIVKRDWLRGSGVQIVGDHWARELMVAIEVDDPSHLAMATDLVFAHSTTLFDDMTPEQLSHRGGRRQLDDAVAWDDLGDRGAWIANFLHYTDHHWFMLQEMRIAGRLSLSAVKRELASSWDRAHSHIALVTPTGDDDDGKVSAAVPAGSHSVTPWRRPVDPALADQAVAVKAPTLAERVTQYELANGLTVELAPDPLSPVVEARLIYPVGRAHEPRDRPGLASAAAWMLSPDHERLYDHWTAGKLNRAMERGTDLDTDVDETTTTFSARGLAFQADWHVWYLSWLLDLGWYNQDDLDRVRSFVKAGLRDADDPANKDEDPHRDSAAFLARLFGADHPYAVPPPDGSKAFLKLRAKDLQHWREAHFRPRGATLIITGGFDLEAMRTEVGELFGPWSGDAPAALPAIPPIAPAAGPSWIAADRAEAVQTTITIGFPSASDPVADVAARRVLVEMLNDALRDIREGMGASYGLSASYGYGAAGGVLIVTGNVDEHLTPTATKIVMEAVARMRDHARDEREAFVRARRKAIADAQAQTGGALAIAGHLEWLAARGLTLRRDRQVAIAIGQLTPAAVAKVAAEDLATTHMVVMLAGKPAAIDGAFAALGVTPERP
ncbi:MAG: insulinase family protein [Deltaproteobacteria bacterium]|nr:insulinase family protein [Deltaproteobacteria bacterium]